MIMFVVCEICWVSNRIQLLADLLGTIRWGRPLAHLWNNNGLIANMKPRAFPWKTRGMALRVLPRSDSFNRRKGELIGWQSSSFGAFVPVIQPPFAMAFSQQKSWEWPSIHDQNWPFQIHQTLQTKKSSAVQCKQSAERISKLGLQSSPRFSSAQCLQHS